MVGKVLSGRYEILERIGQGGMAWVYRGRDLVLNRPVAVKVLRPPWSDDADLVERFHQEARSAAALSDRHVVQVYDVGADGESHYIVMELVEGTNLKDYLAAHGPLGVPEALAVAEQVAEALARAHARHIVHRDIKPQNILLTAEGVVKVADFGIARAMAEATLVNTGSLFGTAQYVSPEQARGRVSGPPTDLYALGAVLYEMLTGVPPYTGDSALAVALKHIQDPVPDPRERRPDLPAPVAQLVMRLLAKDPEDRPPSAEVVAAKLRALRDAALRGEGAEPLPATRPPDVPARRRRPLWPWLVGLAALVLAGAAVLFARWIQGPPPVALPKVVGLPVAEAKSRLAALGLDPVVAGTAPSTVFGKGRVLTETPAAGTRVKPGSLVTLVVSSGPVTFSMPTVIGEDQQQAVSELKLLSLKVTVTTRTAHAAKGLVVAQSPSAGQSVTQGSTVRIVVSAGEPAPPATAVVPNLSGMDTATAAAALNGVGMTLGNVTWAYSTESANTVIDQDPAPAAQVTPGGSVNVTMSKGISPQSQGQPQNESTVSFTVPAGAPSPSWVKAVVTDAAGNEEVYYQQAQPGQTVSFTVVWYGSHGQLVVYLNGQQQGPPTSLTPGNSPSPGGTNGGQGG
jgi:beta-lactam-binding protein with PASTA domain/tRNA A-37 threonylcarbamoyl transferase component Bud32